MPGLRSTVMTAPGPPKLYGIIVMNGAGDTVWLGWLNPLPNAPLPKLCQTVANFFRREGENQNSSYLDAGTFAAASTTDGENIVSVVCSISCPETEVLLKAREVNHLVKLLFGPHLKDLPAPKTAEAAEGTDLMQYLLSALKAPATNGPAAPAAVIRWLQECGSHGDIAAHLLQRLNTLSPCSHAFYILEQAPAFICAHFIDVTDPGEVLLSHWYQGPSSGSSSLTGSPSKAGAGKSSTLGRLKNVMQALGDAAKSVGGRSHSSVVSSVQQLMARPISSLWTIIMRESRNLAMVAAQAKRTVTVGTAEGESVRDHICTVDLSAMVPGAAATITLVQLQHYEAAIVVLYTSPSGASGPKGGMPFHVTFGTQVVPRLVLQQVQQACQDIKWRFPVTREQLLSQIWPAIPHAQSHIPAQQSEAAPASSHQSEQRGSHSRERSRLEQRVGGDTSATDDASHHSRQGQAAVSQAPDPADSYSEASGAYWLNPARASAGAAAVAATAAENESATSSSAGYTPSFHNHGTGQMGLTLGGVAQPLSRNKTRPVVVEPGTRGLQRGVGQQAGALGSRAVGSKDTGERSGGSGAGPTGRAAAWSFGVDAVWDVDQHRASEASSGVSDEPRRSSPVEAPQQHTAGDSGACDTSRRAGPQEQGTGTGHVQPEQANIQARPHQPSSAAQHPTSSTTPQPPAPHPQPHHATNRHFPPPLRTGAPTTSTSLLELIAQQPTSTRPHADEHASHPQPTASSHASRPQPAQPAATRTGDPGDSAPSATVLVNAFPNRLQRRTTQNSQGSAPQPHDPTPALRRPASPNLWRRQVLKPTENTSASAGDPHPDKLRYQPQPPPPCQLEQHPVEDADDKENHDQQRHHRRRHRHHQQAVGAGSPHCVSQHHRGHRRDGGRRHHLDMDQDVSRGRSRREVLGLASASELLRGALEREDDRRWRLQLLCDGIAYRSGMCGAGSVLYPPPWPTYPYALYAPPLQHPMQHLPPYPQPYPPHQQPPVYSQAPAQPPSQLRALQQETSTPASASPPAHTTVHVHAASPTVHATSSPRPPPVVLMAPPGQPTTLPYDIWQLFNGRWYQLVSSGEWVPSASPPTGAHSQFTTGAATLGQPVSLHSLGTLQGRSGGGGGSVSPAAPPCSPSADYVQGSAPYATIAQHYPAAQQASALAQAIAKELVSALQQLVQGASPLRTAVESLPSSSVLRRHQDSSTHPQQTATLSAGATDPGACGPACSPSSTPQYYMGPAGQLYCRTAEGQWYQINPSAVHANSQEQCSC